ncbi:ferredoxin III, nif-specific [Desulfitobacterium sp. AusDCA]|uniref:ferredoxin III, nif-specific n=1 Tax=Desulfitobacterium sp. AusDCA TaxID=3240383 RepID=UPI003DA702B3
MSPLNYQTFGGYPWTPQFIEAIDHEKCLGCGRCVKICGQHCLGLESYHDDEDTERFVSAIMEKEQCIGCQACSRACIRGCFSFKALA